MLTDDPADLHLVANSFAMDEPGMEPLLGRIRIDPSYFDLSPSKKNQSALWLGPKGTVTPLHHDTTNGYYGNPRAKRRGQRVVLGPGDALFLPAGWWHEVRALDASISRSLLAFRKPSSSE